MKATDSLDFAVMALFYAIFGLLLGEPITVAVGNAVRFAGICTMMRGGLDFVRWCRR